MAGSFDFLQGEWPQIHASAKNTERDALFDSRSACFYARRTIEAAVKWLYTVNRLDKPYKDDLSARVRDPAFQAIGPSNVQTKLNLIRRASFGCSSITSPETARWRRRNSSTHHSSTTCRRDQHGSSRWTEWLSSWR